MVGSSFQTLGAATEKAQIYYLRVFHVIRKLIIQKLIMYIQLSTNEHLQNLPLNGETINRTDLGRN